MLQAKIHSTELSRGKKRLFLAITVAIPILFFACLELALRLAGYGPDLSLFTRHEIRKQPYYLMNPGVKFRYFGNLHFTPAASPDYFHATKPPGTFRIFCLGGSTTVGYPYLFNGSFATYLRDRLHATFPQKQIEVVNLGMTATNSFTTLDIARELGAWQPDLIIVYDGHNEFYGALGVASRQTVGRSRFLTLLYLRVIHLRTFLLLRDAYDMASGLFHRDAEPASRGTMMEMLAREQYVPYGSSVYKEAYEAFGENLKDLREYCRSARIPLILATQVSNLRDQSPFVSVPAAGASTDQEAQYRKFFDEGIALEARSAGDSAMAAFRHAIGEDSLQASAHYHLGRCLDASGRKQEALAEYIRARDYDALRFRTDSRFNELIRGMEDHATCFVADIEADFKSLSQDSLIGRNLITEHLHPDARGYFAIARSYASVMREHGLLATPEEWIAADTVRDEVLWSNRSLTDLDERIAAENTNFLTSGWPFTPDPPAFKDLAPTDTLGQIARQIAMVKLDWRKGHEQAIAYYQRRGDAGSVEREYKTLLSQVPLDLQLYMDLAKVYLRGKRFEDLRGIMLRSIAIYPTLQAYRTLGDVVMQLGDPTGAVQYYEKMDDFYQSPAEKVQNDYALSFAYLRSGQYQKARSRILQVLKIRPDLQPARQLLNEVNQQLGQTPATREQRP